MMPAVLSNFIKEDIEDFNTISVVHLPSKENANEK